MFVELYDLCVWSTCCSDVMCVCVTGAVWCSWSSMTCVGGVHVVVTSCVWSTCVTGAVWCSWSSMTYVGGVHVVVTSCVFVLQVLCGVRGAL